MFGKLSVGMFVSVLCGLVLSIGGSAVSTAAASAGLLPLSNDIAPLPKDAARVLNSLNASKSAAAAPASALAAPGEGFTPFDPTYVDSPTYTLRLLAGPWNVDALRNVVQASVNDVAQTSGVIINVAPGTSSDTVPDREPAAGEIFLSVDESTPCGAGMAGCGGPRLLKTENGRAVITAGRIWVYPVVLGYSVTNQVHVVEHELGHALGLNHHEALFNGQIQVMHPSSYDAPAYRSGDRNGLLYLAPRAPIVTTDAASEVGQTTAKLNGSINPNGLATNYYFQYGKTTSYGSTSPFPTGKLGSGTSNVGIPTKIGGLALGTTYHFRLVAGNVDGVRYGADRVFTTGSSQPAAFFADVAHNGSMTNWALDSFAGWVQTPMFGDSIAAGTKPATLKINGASHVFFVDASKSNTISDWVLDPATGVWKQNSFFGDSVAAETSPSAVMFNGAAHVFFVDASKSNTISDWVLDPATNLWKQNFLYGDPVAAKSSPSAVVVEGTLHVCFVDAATGNTISDWGLQSGWGQNRFYGDPVMAGSSPSAISNNGLQVYFADAAKSNSLALWGWNFSGIGQNFLWGDALTPGSSPSVIMNGPTVHAYFSDAYKSDTLSVWKWNSSGVEQIPFWGDSLTAGSSPSAILNGGSDQIYFSDAAKSNTVSLWTWSPTSVLQTSLLGGSVATGSSPSAMIIG